MSFGTEHCPRSPETKLDQQSEDLLIVWHGERNGGMHLVVTDGEAEHLRYFFGREIRSVGLNHSLSPFEKFFPIGELEEDHNHSHFPKSKRLHKSAVEHFLI